MRTVSSLLVMLLALCISLGCTSGKKTDTNSPENKAKAPVSEPKQDATPTSTLSPEQAGGKPEFKGIQPESKGVNLPPEWPADVPIMSGITQGGVISTKSVISFSGVGKVSPKEVEAFYSKLKGWTRSESSLPTFQGQIIFNMVKGEKILQVRISPQEDKTMVNLFYGDKDKIPTLG